MAATIQNSNNAKRTFGVEFEWTVAFKWGDETKPTRPGSAKRSPILCVPVEERSDSGEEGSDSTETENDPQEYILNHIRNTLKEHNIPVQPTGTTPAGSSTGSASTSPSISSSGSPVKEPGRMGRRSIDETRKGRLQQYKGWTVKTDPSIIEPDDDPECSWFGIEITSPAEIASDEAFRAISHVVNILVSKYRIRVNPSTGLHVHVGQGPDFLHLDALRRVAGILWAADPLIACLHPPERRFNSWAQSIRVHSPLALDIQASMRHTIPGQCQTYFGREVRYGEAPVDWRQMNRGTYEITEFEKTRQPGHFEPFFQKEGGGLGEASLDDEVSQDDVIATLKRYSPAGATDSSSAAGDSTRSLDTPYECCRKRDIPRIPIPKYTEKDRSRLRRFLTDNGAAAPPLGPAATTDRGVFSGVQEIFSCRSACMFAMRLNDNHGHNYNFNAYYCSELMNPYSAPRTIEFREAAGTTSARWAETWARICVGIYDWAIHASVNEYTEVLNNCDLAAKGVGKYDIIDLLDQIGLFAESALVEIRLKSQDLWV